MEIWAKSKTHSEGKYVASIRELAMDFESYREREGDGDPEAPPHRQDDPEVLRAMRGGDATITVWQSNNKIK